MPNFRVTEITEVFWSRLEKTEETEVCEDGCTLSIYELILSYMMRSLGMYVSTKKKDNKVMGYKRNDTWKWSITRVLDFRPDRKSVV